MLGTTAKWLRLLGYDTFYSNNMTDNQFLEMAKTENRILLTKDELLSKRAKNAKIGAVFLKGKSHIENLALLSKEFNIDLIINSNKSRCSACNYKITPIDKEKVKDKIPLPTYNQFDEFWICTNINCGKIYYKGHHWINFEKTLDKIKEDRKFIE